MALKDLGDQQDRVQVSRCIDFLTLDLKLKKLLRKQASRSHRSFRLHTDTVHVYRTRSAISPLNGKYLGRRKPVGICGRLSVCVPPKSLLRNPHSQGDGSWKSSLRETGVEMRSRGCGPRDGIGDLFRRGRDQSARALPTRRTHSKKTAVCHSPPSSFWMRLLQQGKHKKK